MNAVDKRWKLTLAEIMNAYNISNRANATPAILECEFCDDLKNEGYAFAWNNFKIYSGLQKKWIADSGFKVCKKSEATCLLFIGLKSDNGFYIDGKYTHYWLKIVQ